MDPIPKNHEAENKLDPRVESLAIPLAEAYAKNNYPQLEDGTFKPAWRGVNGEKELRGKTPEDVAAQLMSEGWTERAAAAEAETRVIDIANTPYDQFSDHWKEQNRGGAEFLIRLVDEYGDGKLRSLDLQDNDVRLKFGDLIHNNWLERNKDWVTHPEHGNPDLAKPFYQLSEEEQQKDIDQLAVLRDWLNKQLFEEFGYSDEEREQIEIVQGLYDSIRKLLISFDPEKYDVRYPGNTGINARGVVIDLHYMTSKLTEGVLGRSVDWRRYAGYQDIVTGVPRDWIARRLK